MWTVEEFQPVCYYIFARVLISQNTKYSLCESIDSVCPEIMFRPIEFLNTDDCPNKEKKFMKIH